MRALDLLLALLGLVLLSPVLLLLFVLVYLDGGQPIFSQMRVGRHQKPFVMFKFRTMRVGTSWLPSHQVDQGEITPIGRQLRRFKVDELPQLWNVLRGEMSLVGPRPCLLTQTELIEERARRGVFQMRPGLTGLAQVRRIDMSTPRLLAETDAQMLRNFSLRCYLSCIVQTIGGCRTGRQGRPGP